MDIVGISTIFSPGFVCRSEAGCKGADPDVSISGHFTLGRPPRRTRAQSAAAPVNGARVPGHRDRHLPQQRKVLSAVPPAGTRLTRGPAGRGSSRQPVSGWADGGSAGRTSGASPPSQATDRQTTSN